MQEPLARVGRLSFPLALFAYPFYLWKRSPGKEGSHFDPACDLFVPSEKNMVRPRALHTCARCDDVRRPGKGSHSGSLAPDTHGQVSCLQGWSRRSARAPAC